MIKYAIIREEQRVDLSTSGMEVIQN